MTVRWLVLSAVLVGATVAVAIATASSGGGTQPREQPDRVATIIVKFSGEKERRSAPVRRLLAAHRLEQAGAVLRGRVRWNVWAFEQRRGDAAEAVEALEALPAVAWAEVSEPLRMDQASLDANASTRASTRSLRSPRSMLPDLPKSRGVALGPNPCEPTCPPPPPTCTGAGGLDDGDPNDPLFCGEDDRRPYYAQQWSSFCFITADQRASVLAGAPQAPQAMGTCAAGAWKLGAQGQGTVIAVLDGGVDYKLADLNMVTAANNPEFADPAFPGARNGWNFFDDNADPMDFQGHGSGRATIAAAIGGNGVGLAGVAPRALVMAVKVGDWVVVHPENFAQGIVYAADHGADAIVAAVGTNGNSRLVREAVKYAESKGVFFASAAGNLVSTQHNYPTAYDAVSGAGAIAPDNAVAASQTCATFAGTGASGCGPAAPQSTFLQKAGFANFGAPLDFALPLPTIDATRGNRYRMNVTGTSSAVPQLAGAAAVLRSAGFAVGMCQGHPNINSVLTGAACDSPALSANELQQLLAYTATRPHNSDLSNANYPPNPSGEPTVAGGPYYPQRRGDPNLGWSIWTGFGRPNLYAATAYVAKRLIPPEAELYGSEVPADFPDRTEGPQPFELLDPTKGGDVPIVGRAVAPRLRTGESFGWKVQVAPCLQPAESDYETIAAGAAPRRGVLARWTPPRTEAECTSSPNQPFSPPGTYTIRLLSQVDRPDGFDNPVADTDPNRALPARAPLYGQARRVLYVREPGGDRPGSPFKLGSSGEGSPTLYDLEGRGELDVIVPTADGGVLALRPDGTPLPGWPVRVDDLSKLGPNPHVATVAGEIPTASIFASVAVGDIDADGEPEVVAASLKGGLYAWDRHGARKRGFPVAVPPPPQHLTPDLARQSPDDDYCRTPHPAVVTEKFSDYGSLPSPVLADLDGEPGLEIVQATGNQCVYAIGGDGSLLWAVKPQVPGEQTIEIAATPAVGDLDGDGGAEVVVGTQESVGNSPALAGRVYALDGRTGAIVPGWPVELPMLAGGLPYSSGVFGSPALYPSTRTTGELQVAVGAFTAGADPAHPVFTINADGSRATTLATQTPGPGSNFTDTPLLWGLSQIAIGKVGPSDTAIVAGGIGTGFVADIATVGKKPSSQHAVAAYDAATGDALPTFPRQIEDLMFASGPALADVKGDGKAQVIAGAATGLLHAFDPAGSPGARPNMSTNLTRYSDFSEPGPFPVMTGDGWITSTPAVGQLSRNGPVTVATVTRAGYLFLTETAGRPEANDQWWRFHHDEWNTGLYGQDTRPPATVDDLRVTAGDTAGSALVGWTEVGDDWWVGKAAAVDLRWSDEPITSVSFEQAKRIAVPPPSESGSQRSVAAADLPVSGPVYFAQRTVDDAGNVSLIAHAVLTPAQIAPGSGNAQSTPTQGMPDDGGPSDGAAPTDAEAPAPGPTEARGLSGPVGVDVLAPALASDRARGPRVTVVLRRKRASAAVARFEVELRDTRWQRYKPLARDLRSHRVRFRGRPGATYLIRARDIGEDGRVSRWSRARTVIPFDDIGDPRGPRFSGGWRRIGWSRAYGGSLSHATRRGARFRMRVRGDALYLVGRVGPSGGRALLTIGHRRVPVSFYSPRTRARQVVAAVRMSARRAQVVELTTLGRRARGSRGTRVEVDAIGIRTP